jgi:hypothetical protein
VLACDSRSVVLAECEQHLAAYLASFTIPADSRAQLRAYVASESSPTDDSVGQRQRLETRRVRLKDLYGWGDLERADYLAQRDLLLRDLAALDARVG